MIRITTPVDGDIVNRHDGTSGPKGLAIEVCGEAEPGQEVLLVCRGTETKAGLPQQQMEVQTTRDGNQFRGKVTLQGRYNTIIAIADGQSCAVRVLWDRYSVPRYRFSVDDSILFLRDLARSDYSSLFDHWYLAFWWRLHQEYGVKVQFNIYYETDPSNYAAGYFHLPALSNRYKEEWQANSDWLRLTFHARSNMPDWPYQDVGYEGMARDYDAVTGEIRRFAGEELLSTFTTVHWSHATREAVRALRDRGVTGLMGLFAFHREAPPYPWYYLDAAMAAHIAARDYWWDPELDVYYVSFDAVLNTLELGTIAPHLEQVSANPHTGELLELMIHEDFFFPELTRYYQPDVQQKAEYAIRWATERGYKPVFWDEGFIGA